MDSIVVKQENPHESPVLNQISTTTTTATTNSGSSSGSDADHVVPGNKRKYSLASGLFKRPKVEDFGSVVPPGFLASFHHANVVEPQAPFLQTMTTAATEAEGLDSSPLPLTFVYSNQAVVAAPVIRGCKQFWKAGDYEEDVVGNSSTCSAVGMDHLRVHPKFLHTNATSHKWALGAFAELLDNSLDEVVHGATYVHVDVLKNHKDGSVMLLVEDNGGGMNPDKMRQCMSLGYSAKSKMANTIGQYGNGFKTSTMRLGADVIVFSRCNDGDSQTQSIGLLSYTFLRATGKEDIAVPMIDFEKRGRASWNKKRRSSLNDWNANLETILQWSPYISEEDLFQQFNFLEDQGTRIVIYNLWEDDEGHLELDLDTDPHDIQIRGVNRDEKNIQMAKKYPNSRHFLTYQHSLRSYAAILYLKLPTGFRIILRGKDVEHHDLVNDMMFSKEIVYRPQINVSEGMLKNNANMVASGMIGFVKDAHHHIDVQGFNVYHKNRLIKPFWRVWNAAGSDGRGVIGVIEANFVQPAHDKQGFELTIVLSRLERRLLAMQKNYWSAKCQEIGYAARRHPKNGQGSSSGDKVSLAVAISPNQQGSTTGNQRFPPAAPVNQNSQGFINRDSKLKSTLKFGERLSPNVSGGEASLASAEPLPCSMAYGRSQQMATDSHSKQILINESGQTLKNGDMKTSSNLKGKERLNGTTEIMVADLLKSIDLEKAMRAKLALELQEKIEELEAEKEKVKQLEKTKFVLTVIILELKKELEDALRIIKELEGSKAESSKIEQQ